MYTVFVLLLTFATYGLPGSEAQTCSKVAIFNAALLHRVGDYEDREPKVAKAISTDDADFYCLQEFWLESDVENLIHQLGDRYPYHYSPIHYRQGELRRPKSWLENIFNIGPINSACSTGDLALGIPRVLLCATLKGCLNKLPEGAEAVGACAAERCRRVIKSKVSATCFSCFILMSKGISEIGEACVPDLGERHNRLNPSGLVLLSKEPLNNIRYTRFNPDRGQTVERGYIEADHPNARKIICTHLTSVSEYYLEYDMLYDNYKDQQTAEIQTLINKYGNIDHLLMGDLNTGPQILDNGDPEKNVTSEVGDNWDVLLDAGYEAPYLAQDGRCTYCKANSLVGDYNVIIDHILSKSGTISVSAIERVLDESDLSDHYGVKATVCTP